MSEINDSHKFSPDQLSCGKHVLSHEFFIYLQAEDFLDEILSLNDGIKLDGSSDIKIKQEPSLSEAEARDRQKKDNHNMSKYCIV